MSQHGDDAVAVAQPFQDNKDESRLSSAAATDDEMPTPANPPSSAASRILTSQAVGEHESFEDAVDAVDAVSVRSLTKKAVSVTVSKSADPDETESTETHSIEADPPSPTESHVKRQSDRPSSSLSSRISVASNLDNVNLNDEGTEKTQGNRPLPGAHAELPLCRPETHAPAEPPSPIAKDQPDKKTSLHSITEALPSLPWSPQTESLSKTSGPSLAAIASPPPPVTQPPAPTRKLTSPFSWLSRNASSSKDRDSQSSPPTQSSPRRNTASSVATLSSNPEMMLSRLEEEKENGAGGSNRESLKDRFKALRMQEEVNTVPLAGDGDKAGDALGLVKQSEEVPAHLPSPVPRPNEDLAPGTVSGIKAGPSAMPDTRVDWDLWQSVVYEGPAAVARTSAEELNKAIATGIPNAIRGVIWQVLAQSNNVDLEAVYQELAVRGTDKSKDRHSNSTTASTISNGSHSTQNGDAVTSSASSVHSEQSVINGSSSPKGDKGTEVAAKEQAAAVAERKKKDKENAAALQKLEKTIRRDLGARTSYSKYAAAAGLQEGLFGVCKAYALYDEAVGYAQGMNFLIMPLLFNASVPAELFESMMLTQHQMPEQEAFCLLVRLMNHYHLRDLFVQDMPGLHMHLYQFERLLEDMEPALYCHLHRRGISPHLYATQWFLTLFAYRFPLQLVLRIYDLILSEGLSAVLRFGLVLMQKNATTLLGISDMQQLTTHLKDKLFDVYIDKDPSQGSLLESGFFGSSSSSQDKEVYRADQFVRDACEVKITPETLKLYTVEWEEKTRSERERELELQELRAANQVYAVKVRKLEERVEVCDREQAALATELVHTKVNNEELRDENESLKGQVRELKVVIEKQPTEIEESWKLERDDLMKRNENVHVENQKLEKEMAELEEELVQTKMQYAEINSQHETLTRKWSDLKRQFA